MDQKISILDIYVTTNKNFHINVEMQFVNQEKIAIAKNLIDILSDDTIAEKVGLPIDFIKKLRK